MGYERDLRLVSVVDQNSRPVLQIIDHRLEEKAMLKTIGIAVLLSLAYCAAVFAAQPQTARKTLPQPTAIRGFPCDKGYAWFFAGGQLQKCTVTREIPFGEITIPAGSWITLTADGKPAFVQMSHDALVV